MRAIRWIIWAVLLSSTACSWTSERDLLRGAAKDSDWRRLPAERQRAILEAEFGPPPRVAMEGSGERASMPGLYTFRLEALDRDGSVAQEERVTLLWPEVITDDAPGAALSATARGPGWQLLQSCGQLNLPRVYLEDMRVGEARIFPRWGSVRLSSLNEREPRDLRQLTRWEPGGMFVAENPDLRATLEAFCVPKVVRVTTRGYQIPGGSTLYEYTAVRLCP